MHAQTRQCCFLMIFAFIGFGFLNKALAESTTVTSSGIKFPDGTTQTTAASGGGSSLWSQSGADIYYNIGNVGIGTTSPLAPLYVHSSVTWPTVPIMTENNVENGTGAGIIMGKSRGTIDSKTIVSNGDNFGALHFAGYDGSTYKVGASIFGEVDGTPTSGSVPGRISFRTSDGTYDAYGLGKERMRIDSSGNVGLGTTSPARKLDVNISSNGDGIAIRGNNNNGYSPSLNFLGEGTIHNGLIGSAFRDSAYSTDATWGDLVVLTASGNIIFTTGPHDQGYPAAMLIARNGNVGIGKTEPAYPLEMESGAHVTTGGVWTDASSRDYKENIRDLSYNEAKLALSSLKPSKFSYKVDKDDEYLGFIAEDVPDLVATKDRKGLSPMDIVAVLTKVVQKQQEEIETLKNLLATKE